MQESPLAEEGGENQTTLGVTAAAEDGGALQAEEAVEVKGQSPPPGQG